MHDHVYCVFGWLRKCCSTMIDDDDDDDDDPDTRLLFNPLTGWMKRALLLCSTTHHDAPVFLQLSSSTGLFMSCHLYFIRAYLPKEYCKDKGVNMKRFQGLRSMINFPLTFFFAIWDASRWIVHTSVPSMELTSKSPWYFLEGIHSQPLVNWLFGSVVWISEMPENKWNCYLGKPPRIPNHGAPNHQFTISCTQEDQGHLWRATS